MLISLTLLNWMASLAAASGGEGLVMQDIGVTRMVVAEEIVIRVPVVRPRPMLRRVRWVETKGPKCIEGTSIRAAALSGERSIDFLLRDRTRLRARLGEDCPTLDFYGSFYIEPRDERICVRREEIKSRMGSACRIERFHRLEPRIP